jgi:hypothetical protein
MAFILAVALVTVAISCMWGVRLTAGKVGQASVAAPPSASAG